MSDPTAPDNAPDADPDVVTEGSAPPPPLDGVPAQPPYGASTEPPYVAPGQHPYAAPGQPSHAGPGPQSYGAPEPQPYPAPGQPYASGQPPYGAGQPYPASGQPFGASGQPLYGAPAAPYGAPPAPYGAPPAAGPDARPKTLAIVALALAAVGLIMAFIPIVTWFSGIFLLAGFVIGLVALISKKQGGKPLSITAIALSVVGWIVSLVVTIASFAVLGQAATDGLRDGLDAATQSPAPSEDESEEPEVATAEQIAVVETAFGQSAADPTSWWYVVIVENPNTDYVYDLATIDIEAIGGDGTILDTATEYPTLLSGPTGVTGSFLSVGQGVITELDVRLPDPSEAVFSAADETGTFAVADLAATTDDFSTTVTGTVSGTFDEDQENVSIAVIARSPDGTIIGGAWTYVERVPVGGGKVQFEGYFFDPLPADATYEAYPSL